MPEDSSLHASSTVPDWFVHLPSAIIFVHPSGQILAATPAALRLAGRTRLRSTSSRLQEWVEPADRRELQQCLELLSEGILPISSEFRLRRRDRTRLVVRLVWSQHPQGILCALEDATQLRQAEEQLRRAERLATLGQLAESILHDLQDSLTVATLRTERLLEHLPQEQREDAELVLQTTRLASRQARRFGEFAEPRSREQHRADLCQSLLHAKSFLRSALGERVPFVVSGTDTPLWVRTTPSMIEHMLLHLSLWARERLHKGGSVRWELGECEFENPSLVHDGTWLEPGRWIFLRMIDTGLSLSPEAIEAALDPIPTRGHPGLLANVQQTARQGGGNLRVRSPSDQGAEITIFLPPARMQESEPFLLDSHVDDENPPHLLVIDDRRDTLAILKDLLGDHGYLVRASTQATQAHELVADFIPDLLITDLDMPEMGGIQLSQEMRRRWPDLPVLFVSSYGDPGNLPLCSDFLHKPFSSASLLEKVRRLLVASL